MNDTVLATVALTGFTVAFFHAAIPTHWLPFVLVGRARGWGRARTVAVVALAGLGHVLLTSVLGLAVAWLGFALDEEVGHAFPIIAGGLLWLVGGYYLWRQWQGRGICHHHAPGSTHAAGPDCGQEPAGHSHWEHELEESPLASKRRGDAAAVGGLFVMLTLSPCEAFLPVYLSGVQFGWMGFWVLSAILAVGALGGMSLFTWLTLLGLERLNLKRFERYESGLVGGLFLLLGGLLVVLEHGHGH